MLALSFARCWASVAAASLALLADSGDRNVLPPPMPEPEKLRVVGDAGKLDFKPGDFRFMLASFASIRLCMEPPTAGERRAVMGSDRAIC